MTDQTISDLPAITLPLTGAELLETERAGVSYKIHSGDVGQSPPTAIAVTSNPVAVDVNPLGIYYEITSSGSAGTEYVNLPDFTLDGDGFNGQFLGRSIRLYFKTQTDPADKVVVKANGDNVVQVFEAQRQNVWYRQTDTNGVVMDTQGQAVMFIWDGYEWAYSIWANGSNDSTQFNGSYNQFFGPGTDVGSFFAGGGFLRGASTTGTGRGGPAKVNAGDSSVGPGGDAALQAGSGGGTGDGGNVYINAGAALGSGVAGNVVLSTLPTVDPDVDGAIWNNLGVPVLSGTVKSTPSTVAALPLAGTAGRRAMVNNALAPAFGAVVAGAGAVTVPVYDDGTNWRVG